MAKITPALFYCSISLLFCSCFTKRGPVTSYNSPAFYNNDLTYQPKPMSSDSSHHAFYAYASFIDGNGANPNDELQAGQLNLSAAFTLKNINLSFGGFGAAGAFHNETIPASQAYYFTEKFAGMTGGRASIDYFFTSGNVDIRIIGAEASYSHEFGSYADFRREVAGQPNFFSDPRVNLFTVGGTSEVIWHSREPSYFQYGFRLFIGGTNNSYTNSYNVYSKTRSTGSISYFMQIQRYFMIADLTSGGGHFSLGIRF